MNEWVSEWLAERNERNFFPARRKKDPIVIRSTADEVNRRVFCPTASSRLMKTSNFAFPPYSCRLDGWRKAGKETLPFSHDMNDDGIISRIYFLLLHYLSKTKKRLSFCLCKTKGPISCQAKKKRKEGKEKVGRKELSESEKWFFFFNKVFALSDCGNSPQHEKPLSLHQTGLAQLSRG